MARGDVDDLSGHLREWKMNVTTVCGGLAMVAFGAVTTVLRIVRPQIFSKLEPMKRRWGERAGFRIHVPGYSILPIVAGIVIALSGALGESLF